MIRWAVILVLLAAVLVSAIGVVMLRHESRLLFTTLQQVGQERDVEQVEWSRLQLEQAWLGEAGRIEREAAEKLKMKSPDHPRVLVRRP